MQTDPISAATGYRMALERILKAQVLQEARKIASEAIEITFKKPEAENVSVSSGLGGNTGKPFVTIALSAPAVQLVSDQAREIALQILEAADAAESDGFVVTWLGGEANLSLEQRGALLQDFRTYRERLRRETSE